MHKHTKGPWALQMAEDCQGRQLDDMVKWVVTANANDLWIATGPTWDAEHDAESIANARLITAAPDLLAALRDVIGWVPGPSCFATSEPRLAVERALATIARATGGQQ